MSSTVRLDISRRLENPDSRDAVIDLGANWFIANPNRATNKAIYKPLLPSHALLDVAEQEASKVVAALSAMDPTITLAAVPSIFHGVNSRYLDLTILYQPVHHDEYPVIHVVLDKVHPIMDPVPVMEIPVHLHLVDKPLFFSTSINSAFQCPNILGEPVHPGDIIACANDEATATFGCYLFPESGELEGVFGLTTGHLLGHGMDKETFTHGRVVQSPPLENIINRLEELNSTEHSLQLHAEPIKKTPFMKHNEELQKRNLAELNAIRKDPTLLQVATVWAGETALVNGKDIIPSSASSDPSPQHHSICADANAMRASLSSSLPISSEMRMSDWAVLRMTHRIGANPVWVPRRDRIRGNPCAWTEYPGILTPGKLVQVRSGLPGRSTSVQRGTVNGLQAHVYRDQIFSREWVVFPPETFRVFAGPGDSGVVITSTEDIDIVEVEPLALLFATSGNHNNKPDQHDRIPYAFVTPLVDVLERVAIVTGTRFSLHPPWSMC